MPAFFHTKHGKQVAALVGIVLLGVCLRAWAVWQLPVDFDEPTYIQAGQDYASLIKSGNWSGVIDYLRNQEHPPLTKLLYSLPEVFSDHPFTQSAILYGGRSISAFFGSLAVLVMALLNPFAGSLLAVHTLTVKYTSQAYLESWPSFMVLISLFALVKMRTRFDRWFWISAAALGAVAAGKFSYAPVLVVSLYLLIWVKKSRVQDILIYLGVAAVVFISLDPMIWHDPINRLLYAVQYHEQYSQGATVIQANYPWYQPFVWISQSAPWDADVFFWGFDELIFLFGVLGLFWEWREHRWVAVWFISGLLFLLLWPTKWPQYTLLIIPPLCLSASAMMVRTYKRIRELDLYWDWMQMMLEKPPLWLYIVMGGFFLVIVGGKLGYEIQMAVLRQGWSQITSQSSPLLSDTIYDIKLGDNNQVVMATGGGVAFWNEPQKNELAGDWRILTPVNSGLPSYTVYQVCRDPRGGWWFATDAGLAFYDGQVWKTYHTKDMGLAGGSIHTIEIDRGNRLWVGTTSGLAEWDGGNWLSFNKGNSKIVDDAVLSIALEYNGSEEFVWVGTLTGMGRLRVSNLSWTNFSQVDANIGWGGIADLMVDDRGQIWASSLGAGVSIFNGEKWNYLRVSNSDIPANTIDRVVEVKPGLYWLATSAPASSGGILVRYDLNKWQQFTPANSGYPGVEPLAITLDHYGNLLVGTRTGGLIIYETP